MSQPRYREGANRKRKYESEIDTIKSLLRQVRNVPSNETYRLSGADEDPYTRLDLEWIIEQLGYRPTRQMWVEAGLEDVDNPFVGQGPDWLY